MRYLRHSDFHYPDSTERLFENSAPLHVEVGFGGGHFWALQHRLEGAVNYLGVEISGVSVQKALAKYRAAGVASGIVTRVAAQFLIRNCLAPDSVDRVYVNFPDPWPKGKHEENRFVRTETFELLSQRLKLGGELWLTTDHPEYYQFALDNARSTGLYAVIETAPPAAALQTKYAQKWQAMGIGINHVRFKKIGSSQAVIQPLGVSSSVTGDIMPHAILTGDIPTRALEKIVLRGADYTVILLEGYARPDKLVVLARIEEPDFVQETLVSVSRRGGGRSIAGLESFGSPLITPGVKAAVAGLTDWLEAGGMHVVQRNY